MTPRFKPGTVMVTVGATRLATRAELIQLVDRHLTGDWGDVDKEDAQANEDALTHGERLLSSYQVKGEKLWVITERDRSQTTVMTPGEY